MTASSPSDPTPVQQPAPSTGWRPNKIIYLAPRPAGADQEAFVRRWHQHGRLERPYADRWTRYELCDALAPAEQPSLPWCLAGEPARTAEYGGVGQVRFEGGAATMRTQVVDWEENERDHIETFGSVLGDRVLVLCEELAIDEGDADGDVRLFSFLKRGPDVPVDAFLDAYRSLPARLAAAPELARHCAGYTQNYAGVPIPGTDLYASDGSTRFDAVSEWRFRTLDDLAAFAAGVRATSAILSSLEPVVDGTRVHGLAARPTVFISAPR